MIVYLEPKDRTRIEREYRAIVNLCNTALGRGAGAKAAHKKVLTLIPPGIYQDDAGDRYRVTHIARERTDNGDERYFVWFVTQSDIAPKNPAKRRLLVGMERGARSGWFNYIEKDGIQMPRYRLISGQPFIPDTP